MDDCQVSIPLQDYLACPPPPHLPLHPRAPQGALLLAVVIIMCASIAFMNGAACSGLLAVGPRTPYVAPTYHLLLLTPGHFRRFAVMLAPSVLKNPYE